MQMKCSKILPGLVTCQNELKTRRQFTVEFFKNKSTTIYFTDINDPKLKTALEWVSKDADDNLLALDLEWMPFSMTHSDDKASLFQIGNNRKVVIIRYLEQNKKGLMHNVLREFLINHMFIGKGISNDLCKLNERFNYNFAYNIADFEDMYMNSFDETTSFDKMIEIYAGNPTAEFKDKNVSISNWNAKRLTIQQFLYSTFDIVGLYESLIGADMAHPGVKKLYLMQLESNIKFLAPKETKKTDAKIVIQKPNKCHEKCKEYDPRLENYMNFIIPKLWDNYNISEVSIKAKTMFALLTEEEKNLYTDTNSAKSIQLNVH